MNKEELGKKVRGIILDYSGLELEDIVDNADFYNDLGFDSIDGIELVMRIEKELKVNISDEDAEAIKNVGGLIEYLNKLPIK
jgi:acyl carrier protein